MNETSFDLLDEQDAADLGTFCSRARRLDATAVRLQASGRVLGVTVCTQEGRGLMGEGTVLALRAFALADDAQCDVLVAIDAVQDRLARLKSAGATGPQRFVVPPVPVVEQWSALTPPRSGWEPVGTIDGDVLTRLATDGMAEFAADRTTATKERIWSQTVPGTTVPAAAALAVHALGFNAPDVAVFTQGRWSRLSSPAGHVLTR